MAPVGQLISSDKNIPVIIEPTASAGLPDEHAALMSALDQPIGVPALRQLVRKDSCVTIVFTDITRATPNHRLIPWLLDYLSGLVPRENITLLKGLGTHRPNTRAELEKLLTPAVVLPQGPLTIPYLKPKSN